MSDVITILSGGDMNYLYVGKDPKVPQEVPGEYVPFPARPEMGNFIVNGERYITVKENLREMNVDAKETFNQVNYNLGEPMSILTPEVVENPQKLTVVADVTKLVVAIGAEIKIDVPGAIKYIDNCVLSCGDEDVEKPLRKWFKDFGEHRLSLTRPINDSLKKLISDEKLIEIHLNKVFAENTRKREAEEKKRREEKHAEVTIMLSDIKAKSSLPQKYLDAIELKDAYLQVTFKGKKLTDDIQAQFDLQERLFKADEDAIALKAANTKYRQMLLDKLNLAYGFKYTYADFLVESFTDEEVEDDYERIAKAKRHEEELRRQREEKKDEAIATVKESLPVEPVVSKTEITEPIGNSEQLPGDLPSYDLPEDLPEYDLPDVELPIPDTVYKSFKFGFTTSFQALSLDNAITKLKEFGIFVEQINE